MGIQAAHHDVFLQPVGMAGCRETKTSNSSDLSWCPAFPFPIGSMYAVYGNIYHQYTPFMFAYIPYMDPMGLGIDGLMDDHWGGKSLDSR
jgi:hypothetical protein